MHTIDLTKSQEDKYLELCIFQNITVLTRIFKSFSLPLQLPTNSYYLNQPVIFWKKILPVTELQEKWEKGLFIPVSSASYPVISVKVNISFLYKKKKIASDGNFETQLQSIENESTAHGLKKIFSHHILVYMRWLGMLTETYVLMEQ